MNELSPEQKEEQRKKEYRTVVLAALLHDVGKFLHRVTGIDEFQEGFSGVHQKLGADFVSGKGEFSLNGKHSSLHSFSQMIHEDWVDKGQLEHCIRKHHTGGGFLAWIVHKADSYSTKERFREGESSKSYPPKGPMISLRSVFASVDIRGGVTRKAPSTVFSYKATKGSPDK